MALRPPYIRSSDGCIRQGAEVVASDLPALGLDGADLSFIRIDNEVRLQFDQVEFVILGSFRLLMGGDEWVLDSFDRRDLGRLLGVYPGTVASASVSAALTLVLAFENGIVIEVEQDLHYEAWWVVGPGSRMIVCPPAGNGTASLWL
jgi:hypothetical protein